MHLLQIDRYSNTNSSNALISYKITACLNYNYLSVTNNERLTSKPTDNQWLNSVASLIPFATIEKDLKKYYNYSEKSYITFELEEDNSDTSKV
ncbi:13408_t:CDS:2 [Cetraspora pellucida]|uniref:13408_t:CDS:1 n=1 Tax=Cetraspora pellucida TaxID=1433469 RepID=A0ACA9KHT3_9GLOM|nr:13408_t:CDS:2 [Cetraspora pellucida]